MDAIVGFEAFRETWLEEVRQGDPSTTALSLRFARKLIGQWLDLDEGTLDVTVCDGAGDGGIDMAVLQRGDAYVDEETEVQGEVWLLIQSKYGSAFAGDPTLLSEGHKVIDTLDGSRANLVSCGGSEGKA